MSAQLAGKRVFIAVSPSSGAYKELKNALSQCTWSEFLDKHVDVIIVDQIHCQDKHFFPIAASESRISRMIKKSEGKARSGSLSVMKIGRKWNIPMYDYRSIPRGSQLNQKNLKNTVVVKLTK